MKKSYLSKVVSKAIAVAKRVTFDLIKFEVNIPTVSEQYLCVLDPVGLFNESEKSGYYSNKDFDNLISDTFGSSYFTRNVIWYDVDEAIVREYVYDLMTVYSPGEIERMMLDGKPIVLHSELLKLYPMWAGQYETLEGLRPYTKPNIFQYIKEYDSHHNPVFGYFCLSNVRNVVFDIKLDYPVDIFRNRAYHKDGKLPDTYKLLKLAVERLGCPNAKALLVKDFAERNGYADAEIAKFSLEYDVLLNVGQSTRAIFCLVVDGKEQGKHKALLANMRPCDRVLVVHTDYIDDDHRDYRTEVMTPASYLQYRRGLMDNMWFDGSTVIPDGRGGYAKLFEAPVDKLSVEEQNEVININELREAIKNFIVATDPSIYEDYVAGYLSVSEACGMYLDKLPELIGANYRFNRLMLKAISWLESETVYECPLVYKKPLDSITKDNLKYAEAMLTKDMAKEWDNGKKSTPAYTANYRNVYFRDKIKTTFNYSNGRTRKAGNFDVSNFDLAEEFGHVLKLIDTTLNDSDVFELYKKDNTVTCPDCASEIRKDWTGEERFVIDGDRVAQFVEETEDKHKFECVYSGIRHDDLVAYARKYLPKVHEREYFCPHCQDTFWFAVDEPEEVIDMYIDPCDNYTWTDRKALNSDDDGDFDVADIFESI